MSLHLVELLLDVKALHLWAGGRKLGQPFDEGQTLHHLLNEVFGPSVLQPFRLMVSPGAHTGTIYAYAAQNSEDLRIAAMANITPLQNEVIDLQGMRSLPRPTNTWRSGQRIGFDVRLRPVVRLASSLDGQEVNGSTVSFRKGAEIDAFLALVLRGTVTSRADVYMNWLAKRLGVAAELDLAATHMVNFERNVIRRGGKRIEGPDIVVHGTLNIVDAMGFQALLANGVGRHRAYGYGMLLLRPAQRLD